MSQAHAAQRWTTSARLEFGQQQQRQQQSAASTSSTAIRSSWGSLEIKPTHNPLSPDHLHRTKVAQEVNRMEQRIKPDALCVVGNQSAGVVVDPLHFPGHTRTDDRASLNAFNGTLRPSLRSLVA